MIERERAALGASQTKVTLETFLAWKKRKIREREEAKTKETDRKKAEYKAGRSVGVIMTCSSNQQCWRGWIMTKDFDLVAFALLRILFSLRSSRVVKCLPSILKGLQPTLSMKATTLSIRPTCLRKKAKMERTTPRRW